MSFTKINDTDYADKGVIGLADTPGLTTQAMQEKFDEIAIDVIIPKTNNLIDELEATTASASVGAVTPTGLTASANLQAIINALYSILAICDTQKHTHSNKTTLDNLTQTVLDNITEIETLLTGISNVVSVVNGSTSSLPNCKAIADYVQQMGGGDMTRAMYDSNNDGIVNQADLATNATKLNNQSASYYQKATDSYFTTSAKTVVGAVNEVNSEVTTVSSTKQNKIKSETSITSIAVADVVTNEDDYSATYPYKADLAVSGVTATMQADITFNPSADISAVGSHTQCFANLIRLYFTEVPSASIAVVNVTYWEVG